MHLNLSITVLPKLYWLQPEVRVWGTTEPFQPELAVSPSYLTSVPLHILCHVPLLLPQFRFVIFHLDDTIGPHLSLPAHLFAFDHNKLPALPWTYPPGALCIVCLWPEMPSCICSTWLTSTLLSRSSPGPPG